MKNYYELIGVAHSATATEIKAQYRALSKSYHPDTGGTEQQMAQLNEAHRVLTNPLERTAYDRRLARERDATRAATAHRERAAQKTYTQTTVKHQEARAAYAKQQAQQATKKSGFWKFMAWSTAAYVVIGLALVYSLTAPTTAADTAETPSATSTSLAQEAANASAQVPETPTATTETAPTTTDSSQPEQQTNTTTTTQPETDTSSTDCDAANDPSTNSCEDKTNQQTHRQPNWRTIMPF